MAQSIPFLNFSLKRVLGVQTDNLQRARIKIVYVTLLLTLLKILILTPLIFNNLHNHQLARLGFVFVLYLFMTKYLLYKPGSIDIISHIILLTGIGGIWSSLLYYGQHLNLVTIQFVFMVTFVGHYLINNRFAIIYSVLAISPVMFYIIATDRAKWHLDLIPAELPSPGFELIVFMNFITTVLIHYLFYNAFKANVKEKEALNKQLQATVAETRALAESRSLFLSTMSHELRTPLNAVIGMTNLVKDTATPDQAENLEILEFSAVSLLTLVNDILDFNKSENDMIRLEAIPVNLAALLHKVCYGLQQKAAEKGIDLVLGVDEQLKEQWVSTDPTRITQIIYNLAGNAIKFTQYGQVNVKVLAAKSDDETVTVDFSVSDTGIGIPAERMEEIFEPFVQASASTTRHYGGTGLGLAIVKRLLQLFNSTIRLESTAGVGSVFAFTIEFARCKEIPAQVMPPAVMNGSLGGINVLIADDNSVNTLLLVKLLTRWHVNVAVAVNGQEAVDKLLDKNFDAILIDLHMPVLDGYEAAAFIRSLDNPAKANVHIIALTASVAHNIYEKVQEAGMNDYLTKPFQPATLYQKLAALRIGKGDTELTGYSPEEIG